MAGTIEMNIETAANNGPDAVTSYIRGKEGDKTAQIDRADEALNALKRGIEGVDDAKKKPILKAIISELDLMRMETRNDPKLQDLDKRLMGVKKIALDDEREGAQGTEIVTNEIREVITDIKPMDRNALKAAGVAAIPLLIGGFVTWSIAKGAAAKGFITRWFKRITGAIAGAAAGVAVFLGLRSGERVIGDAKDAYDNATNFPDKVENAAKGLWNSSVGALIPGAQMDTGPEKREELSASPQRRLEQLVRDGKYADAYLHAKKNGGGVVIQDGKVSLTVEGGEPVDVTPEAATVLQELIDKDNGIGGYVWLWFEFGVGYLVSRAIARKILYGTAMMPKGKWGKLWSIGKTALGPLTLASDIAKPGLTTIFSPRGFDQVRAAYVSQSLPARALRNFSNWRRQKWFQSDINTEEGLIETIHRRQQIKDVVDVLELGIGETNADGTGDIDKAKVELEGLTKRVKAGLTVMEGKMKNGNLKNANLAILVGKRENTNFEDKLKQFSEAEGETDVDVDVTTDTKTDTGKEPKNETNDEAKTDAKPEVTTDAVDTAAPKAPTVAPAVIDTSTIEARIDALEKKFDEQSAGLQEELKKATSDGAAKNETIEKLQTQIADTEAELQAERTHMAEELGKRAEENAALQQKVKGLEDDLMIESSGRQIESEDRATLQAEIDAKNAELRKMTAEYEAAKQKLTTDADAHAQEVKALRTQLQDSNALIGQQNNSLANSETEAAALKEKLAAGEAEAQAAAPERKNRDPNKPNPGESGDSDAASAKANPNKPVPGGETAKAQPDTNPLRPPRKPVTTNPDVTGAVRQDRGFGSVDLKNGRTDTKGDTDGKTDIRIRK